MSPRLPRQNTESELKAFDSVCERLGGFDERIDFEWVDGFLASLAALPSPPEPAVWLPAMCEDAFERAFADPEDHARALAVLLARLKVLCDQLDPEALLDDPDLLRLDPLIGEISDADRQRLIDEDGMPAEEVAAYQTGMVWAQGMLSGVQALPALWQLPADEEASVLFEQAFDQLTALLLPPDSEEWKAHVAATYPKGDPTRDELIAEACMSVQDLRLFWVDFAPRTGTRRVEAAPGRNDPCPCGSGKKFKKCHGGAA
jgi:uncharacterized protein